MKKLNEEKGITIVVAEQKIMLLCEFVKKLIVLEKGTCVHYGEIRSTLTHKKEMEEAGINSPRVLTLTAKLVEENLVPKNMKSEDSICLNAEEAADFIKKVAKIDSTKGNQVAYTAARKSGKNKGTDMSFSSMTGNSAPDDNAVLEFQNVAFSYNETANVHNLNVKVKKGDFISIIGSNGAGKSTFSKLCNGLLKPSSGDVLVLGESTKKRKVSSLAKHIGFLFQNPDRQICCATVREEIAFSLKNNGIPQDEIEKRVTDTLNEFGFDGDTEPFNMSRGQRQRLCLACLIALNPEILILDEPTTGLDYRECMEVMGKIAELNNKGTTVIMVCHDMEVVLDFAKTIIVMNRGEILAEDETRTVLGDRPLLERARLLPPQIAQVSMLLGNAFNDVFTADEMIKRIKEVK